MKKITTEYFIEKAKEVHGEKYDYSLTIYTKSKENIVIICPIHGEFKQRASHHLSGCGCGKCSIDIKKTSLNDFINKCIIKHNNKYDYSLVEYKNSHSKVKIICPIHGTFEQSACEHLKGSGCPQCAQTMKLTTDIFITQSKLIHNDKYDYKLVEYIGIKYKVKIICPIHGEFEQRAEDHLKGHGCRNCSDIIRNNNITKDKEYFINKAKIKHGDKYDYSLVKYKNAHKKVKIICSKHCVFEQIAANHLTGNGCPICNESNGEKQISLLLLKHNINYIKQKTFKKCEFKKLLKFDFYLSDYNVCIEYDGIQHFEALNHWGGKKALELQIIKDNIKNDFCKNNNIKLYRIKYNDNIVIKIENIIKNIK